MSLKSKYSQLGVSLIAIAMVVMSLLQLWFSVFANEIFVKIIISLCLLVLLIAVLVLMRTDMGESKRLRDEGFVD
jgi:hypothetical protein